MLGTCTLQRAQNCRWGLRVVVDWTEGAYLYCGYTTPRLVLRLSIFPWSILFLKTVEMNIGPIMCITWTLFTLRVNSASATFGRQLVQCTLQLARARSALLPVIGGDSPRWAFVISSTINTGDGASRLASFHSNRGFYF